MCEYNKIDKIMCCYLKLYVQNLFTAYRKEGKTAREINFEFCFFVWQNTSSKGRLTKFT